MKTLIFLLSLAITLAACGGKQQTEEQAEYLPVVVSSLSSGEAVMAVFELQYLATNNQHGCMVASTLRTAFSTSADTLQNLGEGIPEVYVNFNACLGSGSSSSSEEEQQMAQTIIDLGQAVLSTVALIVDRSVDDPGQCRVRAIAQSAFEYVSNAVEIITEEVVAPDGVLLLEGFLFDFSECVTEDP